MTKNRIRQKKYINWSLQDLANFKQVTYATVAHDSSRCEFDPKDIGSVIKYLCKTRDRNFSVEVEYLRAAPKKKKRTFGRK